MRYDVALAACKSYEDAEVSAALETAVTAAGGLDWVTPGMRGALKLNLVSAMKPEEAATVHPAVVCGRAGLTSSSATAPAGCTTPRICSASTT